MSKKLRAAVIGVGYLGRFHAQKYAVLNGAGGGVELPFGGTKRSGHGREKGLLALEEVSTTKTLVHWHG